jgi:hypothetical protein
VFRRYARHLRHDPLYQQEIKQAEDLIIEGYGNVWVGMHILGNTCLVAHVEDDFLLIDMIIGGNNSLPRYFDNLQEIAKVVGCKGFQCQALSKSRERYYKRLGFTQDKDKYYYLFKR